MEPQCKLLNNILKVSLQLHTSIHVKGLHAAPVVFEVSQWLRAALCIFKLHLKGLHAASVVFEVYTVAPCGFMHL